MNTLLIMLSNSSGPIGERIVIGCLTGLVIGIWMYIRRKIIEKREREEIEKHRKYIQDIVNKGGLPNVLPKLFKYFESNYDLTEVVNISIFDLKNNNISKNLIPRWEDNNIGYSSSMKNEYYKVEIILYEKHYEKLGICIKNIIDNKRIDRDFLMTTPQDNIISILHGFAQSKGIIFSKTDRMDRFDKITLLRELLDNNILTQEEYNKETPIILDDEPSVIIESYEDLKLIKKLQDGKIITQEEFDKERQRILDNKSSIIVKMSDELQFIKGLLDDGCLTQDEFVKEKQMVLRTKKSIVVKYSKELQLIKELFDDEILTQEKFDKERQKILENESNIIDLRKSNDLQKIKELLDNGTINQEIFDKEIQKILNN